MFVCRYDEHNLPWQQSAGNESTVVQEPAYADAQTVINSTTATNASHNQYREHRKEVYIFTVAIVYQMGGNGGLLL